METDRFAKQYDPTSGPAEAGLTRFREITPSDTVDLEFITRAILVEVAGDVAVLGRDDTSAVIVPLLAGWWYPMRVKRILATGTTATGIRIAD